MKRPDAAKPRRGPMFARTMRTADPKRAVAGLMAGKVVTLDVPRSEVDAVGALFAAHVPSPVWHRIIVRGSEATERAGCIELRTTRKGIQVGLYRSAESFETDPDVPYTTVCETHGTLVSHETRRAAEESLSHPEWWCDDCRYGPEEPEEEP